LKKRGKKSNKHTLLEDPLERCHLRWHCLFWGVWKAVCKHDRNLEFGLLEALKEYGFDLLGGSVPEQDPFKLNPSDEVLKKALAFSKGATIANLRGRRPPWSGVNPLLAFMDYSHVLHLVLSARNIPKYSGARRSWFRGLLLSLKPDVSRNISDGDLDKLVAKTRKETIARNVTAYLYNMGEEAFRKYLTQARRQFPGLATAWKYGANFVRSSCSSPEKKD
jgi:hypothetical protein